MLVICGCIWCISVCSENFQSDFQLVLVAVKLGAGAFHAHRLLEVAP